MAAYSGGAGSPRSTGRNGVAGHCGGEGRGARRGPGELLGTGTAAAEIPGLIGQASEGLDTTPLLAQAVAASGGPAEALNGLAALIRGEIGAEDWVAGLRRVERSRRAA